MASPALSFPLSIESLRASKPRNRRGTAHYEATITGRYRSIPVRELALAWFLFTERHITKRQLRLWFAAHEMSERRAYGRTQNPAEKPVFVREEILRLLGGVQSERAVRGLLGDLKHLADLGLVTITQHTITFAHTFADLSLDEEGSAAFNTFLSLLPNRSRRVPVPRRMVRALAAGFGKAETAYVLAFLIRGLYWSRKSGLYRVDGRMKLSQMHEVMGVSRSAFSDARQRLIAIGWLEALPVPQWAANRFGIHDRINVHWVLPGELNKDCTEEPTDLPPETVDNSAVGEGRGIGSGQPTGDSDTEIDSLSLNKSLPSERLNNIRLGKLPDPVLGSRERKSKCVPPSLRRVTLEDLTETERLMALYAQALALKLAKGGGAGQIDFLCYANRARSRGRNPGALFLWLLKQDKREFITYADEEDATRRLSEYLNGRRSDDPAPTETDRVGESSIQPTATRDLHRSPTVQIKRAGFSPLEEQVQICLDRARLMKIEPEVFAGRFLGWPKKQWQEAYVSHQIKQQQLWGENLS